MCTVRTIRLMEQDSVTSQLRVQVKKVPHGFGRTFGVLRFFF
jgi:hypothetical protein